MSHTTIDNRLPSSRAQGVVARAAMFALLACIATATTVAQGATASESSPTTRLYIVAYGEGRSDGIYMAELALDTGELRLVDLVAPLKNAAYLAIHPNRQYLYAACEVGDYVDSHGGGIAALKIDAATGKLTPLNSKSSAGANPCYISFDRQGKHALVANYDGGNVAVLPIDVDGRLGASSSTMRAEGSSVNKSRQAGPHPHAICLDPADRLAFVPDLGLDQIIIYRFNAETGELAPSDPTVLPSAPGAGPRHFVFYPNGRWAYAINELDSTITTLKFDADAGLLTPLGVTSTRPLGSDADNITAEIEIHPNGRFLYSSNRGDDTLAMFAINSATGELTSLGHHSAGGCTPVSFSIDPTGKYLLSANQDSNGVVVHEIDVASGTLAQTSHEVRVRRPVCIQFAP